MAKMIRYAIVFLDDATQTEKSVFEDREEGSGFPQNFDGMIGTTEGSGKLVRIELVGDTPVEPEVVPVFEVPEEQPVV